MQNASFTFLSFLSLSFSFSRFSLEMSEEVQRARRMALAMLRSEPKPTLAHRTIVAAGVRNVVGSASLVCDVNLTRVLARHRTSYRPEFTSIVQRGEDPYHTVLQFRGYAVVIGSNSKQEMLLAVHQQRLMLLSMGLRPQLRHFSVDNIVVSGSVPHGVEIAHFENDMCMVVYTPYLFPAMIWRFINPEATALVFRGGAFLMMGIDKIEYIDLIYKKVVEILAMHSFDASAISSGGLVDTELSAAQTGDGARQMTRAQGRRKRENGAGGGGGGGMSGTRGGGGGGVSGAGGGAGKEFTLMPSRQIVLIKRINERLKGRRRSIDELTAVYQEELERMRKESTESGRKGGGAGAARKRKQSAAAAPAKRAACMEKKEEEEELLESDEESQREEDAEASGTDTEDEVEKKKEEDDGWETVTEDDKMEEFMTLELARGQE